MSKLSDLVKVNHRFEKSVNLLLDIDDPKKLDCYIPTHSSVNLLMGLLKETTEQTGNRSILLVGPYGKGKSHLLLVLANILKNVRIKELYVLENRMLRILQLYMAMERQHPKEYRYLFLIIWITSCGNYITVRCRAGSIKKKTEHEKRSLTDWAAAILG